MKVADQALKHLPNDASLYFNIANILGKSGKFVEAEIYFQTAISKDSNDPSFYTNLGKRVFIFMIKANEFDD